MIVLSITLCFWGEASDAQDEGVSSHINTISVVVDGQPVDEGYAELIPVKIGDTFSLININNSIKQIHKSGLFSNVQVLREGDKEVHLTYLLTGRILVRSIHFIGAEDIPRRRLEERLVSLSQGSPVSDARMEKAVEELKKALREEGDFQVSIRAYTERIPDSSQVDVYFQVQSFKHYRVAEIAFIGNVLFSDQELKGEMETRIGDKYVPSLLKRDIEKVRELYASQDYQRVEIGIKEEDFNDDLGHVSLKIEIEPHEKIVITINGADVPLELVQPIWEARIFKEWGLDEGEAKIKGYLRNKGYLFALVDSSIEEKDNEIHIIYEVTPGKKYRTEDISFQGLNYFTSDQLKEKLAIQERVPFLGKIEGARLFEIPYEIEFLYQTQGFPETRVDLSFEEVGGKVKPVYFIEEGRQEIVENVSFPGISLFPPERLLQEISSIKGQPFYQPTIQRDIERIEGFYLNEGVRGSKVRAVIQNLGDDLFSVSFQLEEGERVTVGNVVITGNNVTKKSTIIRELLIEAGDVARFNLIRESKRRLEALGVFSEVKIEEILLSNQRMNLLINVSEGERNYVSLGLGLETKNEPRSFEVWNNEVRLRGTAELVRNNIFGTAAQISLVGQISIREKRAVALWQQPYFFGIPLRPVLNAWIEREERTSYSYDRRGISLSGVISLSRKEDLALLSTLRFARTKLLTLEIEESEVDRQFFPYSTTSLSESLIWDRRSDPFNPESGFFFSSAVEWAYPLFNAESDFLKSFSKYQHYFQIWTDVVASVTTRLGLGRGRMPIHERFFAGGSNSFRGARFDELGPRDPDSGQPVGGKSMVLVNIELTFPIMPQLENLYGVVFYDKGNVFSKRRQTSLAGLEDALGIGLRYRTPLGPVRFELGWNPSPQEGKSKVLLFFTIGNLF